MAKKTTKRPAKVGQASLHSQVREAVASGGYLILPHARQRCSERDVAAPDVAAPDIEFALTHGHRVPRRDRYEVQQASWSTCFEGRTVDDSPLRVIIAFELHMLVITVIRLDV